MPQILVIGATGTVGSQVTAQLREKGIAVRAMVRNRQAARLPDSVEVVQGDLTVLDTLDACLEGINTVFLVWTAPPPAVPAALERITQRARRIVLLSAPHQTPHPLFSQPNAVATLQKDIERRIRESGREWTFLRPGMFASNVTVWWGPQLRTGNVVRWPYLDTPTAPIDPRDIARIGVCALTEAGHAGKEYLMTGPEAMTQREQIATLGRVLGREPRIEEIAPEDIEKELITIMPPPVIRMLCNAWAAAVGVPALQTLTVEEVTGTPARTFADWVRDHERELN